MGLYRDPVRIKVNMIHDVSIELGGLVAYWTATLLYGMFLNNSERRVFEAKFFRNKVSLAF